jgi:hypothetical protein
MKSLTLKLSALGLSAALLGVTAGAAEPAPKEAPKETPSFATLQVLGAKEAKAQAQDWLKSVGKTDEATQKALEAVWAQTDRSVLDLVADSLALGNADAAKLLAEARDPDGAPPKEVPSIVKDLKLPTFFRANLAMAYAKELSNRRVYEEALDALKNVRPDQVVDPSAYYFHKGVAEHGTNDRLESTRSIMHLLVDVPDAPARYRVVGLLMLDDMQRWNPKSLEEISRKMNNIGRRLDLTRGGPQTQKYEKEVLARLDEMIKKEEQKQQGGGGGGGGGGGKPNDGGCPDGSGPGNSPGNSPGNTNTPSAPQQDSYGGTNSGPGKVDPKKLKELAENWGKLPERERAEAITALKRGLPPDQQAMIQEYFRRTTANNRDNDR